MRRTALITLHWTNFLLLVLLVAGGPLTGLAWAFAASGLGMGAIALVGGLMNGPGPKLTGFACAAHPWQSRAMYAALAIVAALTLWDLTGALPAGINLARIYFYLLAASALHAIFHLWRHTALCDGALKRILPKTMHGML